MNANEYQKLAGRTSNKKLDPKTALQVAALGLCGEAGETSEHVKKHIAHGQPLDRERFRKELGDVLWYAAEICTLMGWDLSDVMAGNIDKLRQRWPGEFDPTQPQAAGEGEAEGTE